MYNEFERLELWSDSSDTQGMYYMSLGMIARKSKGAPSYFLTLVLIWCAILILDRMDITF